MTPSLTALLFLLLRNDGDWPADHLLRRPTEQALGCWVPRLDNPLGIEVTQESAGNFKFAVLEHGPQGNGGCLVPKANEVSATGILVYMNVDGRIRDAIKQAEKHGGRVVEKITGIGPHGFRAVILDSEGNRIALHSNTDK